MTADASALRNALTAWAPKVVSASADILIPFLQAAAPVAAVDGGATKRGCRKGAVAGTTAHVVNDVPQAAFTNDGTVAHTITATRPHGLLVFDAGGETVFTRRPVNHPGSTKHKGWWDRVVLAEGPRAMQQAADRTPV